MLGRTHRFHGYNSVLPVYKKSQVVRADGCSLHFSLNPRRKQYRLAVVVSKKVSKSAVKRNRIRRRIYEIVRQTIKPSQPHDLIITIYSDDLIESTPEQLTKTIQQLFKKSQVDSR